MPSKHLPLFDSRMVHLLFAYQPLCARRIKVQSNPSHMVAIVMDAVVVQLLVFNQEVRLLKAKLMRSGNLLSSVESFG